MNAPVPRRLRADAARNAERVIGEARRAFADCGVDVSLEEIARRAGVGVATLYRRFPSKDDLIRAVLESRYAEIVEPAVKRALADDDPWRGLVTVLEAAMTLTAQEHATIKAGRDPAAVTNASQSRLFAALATLLLRAQDAGAVRADLSADDLPILVFMLISTLRMTKRPGHDWHRYLALLLDALPPAAATPLPPIRQG